MGREARQKHYDESWLPRDGRIQTARLDEFRALSQRKRLGVLSGLAILALLIATLWPFECFPSNGAGWLAEANGLRFEGAGIVLGEGPLQSGAMGASDSASLEILLRPRSAGSSSKIACFYSPETRSEFAFGQYRDGFTVSRHFLNATEDAASPEIVADHVFESGKLILLTITTSSHGAVIYKNGVEPQAFEGFRFLPSDLSGPIILGTSVFLSQPYVGEIRGLAVYSKALTPEEVLRNYGDWTAAPGTIKRASIEPGTVARYDFTEGAGRKVHSMIVATPSLEIPEQYVVPHKPFLESPADEFVLKWDYARDVFENIVGFVPLGFVVCAYFACTRSPSRAIVYATIVGGGLSLVIEVLQFYVPPRGSGITDVITNGSGAFLGALLARSSVAEMILQRAELIVGLGKSKSQQG